MAEEFSTLLKDNPRVSKVWSFDRKRLVEAFAWLKFLRELKSEDYDLVLDAHSSLRTFIARVYFLIFSPKTRWKKISKSRWRRLGYITFKKLWPSAWRPIHLSHAAAKLAGGTGQERPELSWITTVAKPLDSHSSAPLEFGNRFKTVAIVPSSAWPGKQWRTGHYLEWMIAFRKVQPDTQFLILGMRTDRAATELRNQLVESGIKHKDGIGHYNLPEVAAVLSQCDLAVGVDTGLLHLSEAVGTPVVALFGPTRSDFGFGPTHPQSVPCNTQIWCSPCSKDGTLCFRPFRRFKCMEEIAPEVLGLSTQSLMKETRAEPLLKSGQAEADLESRRK
ncbi:MAG: glycosyltransferase family 9 protein [Cryobacterium sp.]|nr:glycosyltransferase family 9 protein [Oligoflexia bacterium]